MIVLTCVCVPQAGHEEESQAAARELAAVSQGHDGLIGYFWSLDEATQDLHLVEVHRDEASIAAHVASSDVSRLVAVSTITDIRVFGAGRTPGLAAALGGFGAYSTFPSL